MQIKIYCSRVYSTFHKIHSINSSILGSLCIQTVWARVLRWNESTKVSVHSCWQDRWRVIEIMYCNLLLYIRLFSFLVIYIGLRWRWTQKLWPEVVLSGPAFIGLKSWNMMNIMKQVMSLVVNRRFKNMYVYY